MNIPVAGTLRDATRECEHRSMPAQEGGGGGFCKERQEYININYELVTRNPWHEYDAYFDFLDRFWPDNGPTKKLAHRVDLFGRLLFRNKVVDVFSV